MYSRRLDWEIVLEAERQEVLGLEGGVCVTLEPGDYGMIMSLLELATGLMR